MNTYIIYCPEFQESVDICAKTYAAAKANGLTPHKVVGVNPHNAAGVMGDMGVSPDYTWVHRKRMENNYFKRQLDSGCVRGCFMSHYKLWLKCVEMDEPIVILEHDGLIIKEIPKDLEWSGVLDLARYRFNDNSTRHPELYSKTHSNEYVFGPGDVRILPYDEPYILGAYAYAIKPIAAQQLIYKAKHRGFTPADVFIDKATVDLQYTSPQYAVLDSSYKLSLTNDLILWKDVDG